MSVSEVLRVCSNDSQLLANTAIYVITIRFPWGAASKDCGYFANGEEAVDPESNSEFIEL